MVQYSSVDRTFAALADPTRRNVLERLGTGGATITELAQPVGITLTGMKKHVRLLEQAGLVTTEKIGRTRHCRLGPRRLDDVAEWVGVYRGMLDERLDRFGALIERLQKGDTVTTTQQQPGTTGITTPGDREIRVERVFDAPRERVYAAFNDPALIPEWWGPEPVRVDAMDVRPGGTWRYVSTTAVGAESGFRGTYREVTPPQRIVRTFEWEGMPGHVLVESAQFEDVGGRTRVVTTLLFHTTEERDGMIAAGMARGLNASYARLDDLLGRTAA